MFILIYFNVAFFSVRVLALILLLKNPLLLGRHSDGLFYFLLKVLLFPAPPEYFGVGGDLGVSRIIQRGDTSSQSCHTSITPARSPHQGLAEFVVIAGPRSVGTVRSGKESDHQMTLFCLLRIFSFSHRPAIPICVTFSVYVYVWVCVWPHIVFHWSVCPSQCHCHTKYWGFIIILDTQKGKSAHLILTQSCLGYS